VLPDLAVKVQRIVHELVGQARLLRDPARSDQVADAVRPHIHALDVALPHEPLQIDVGQSERDPELAGEAALRQARVLFQGFEQFQVAMFFNIHFGIRSARRQSRQDRRPCLRTALCRERRAQFVAKNRT
jgi:hypothetical protein